MAKGISFESSLRVQAPRKHGSTCWMCGKKNVKDTLLRASVQSIVNGSAKINEVHVGWG